MSWVVCEKESGRAVLETFSPKVAASVNLAKYEVLPVLDYLARLNNSVKQPESNQ